MASKNLLQQSTIIVETNQQRLGNFMRETSSYLAISLTKNERKLLPYSITQTIITEGYTLSIEATNDALTMPQGKQKKSLELFFDALKTVVPTQVTEDHIKCDKTKLIIEFPNQVTLVEKFLTKSSQIDAVSYCRANGIETSTGDMFYRGDTLELSGLTLLLQACKQNLMIILSEMHSANRREIEGGSGPMRY